MRTAFKVLILLGVLSLTFGAAFAATNDHDSVVITFKDGHQQSFPLSEVAHIQFKAGAKITAVELPPATPSASMGHFLGRWRVGNGSGGTFIITLERNGSATKTTGGAHGTWIMENGEAHISWDDGWRDAIRKVGNNYEKVAYAPGRTFSDKPDNTAEAKSLDPI